MLAPDDAVADVRGERRVKHLNRLEPEGLDPVEQTLAGAEQDGGDVEDELVDGTRRERLATGVDAPPAMSTPGRRPPPGPPRARRRSRR